MPFCGYSFLLIRDTIGGMISPYPFQPRGRLLNVMRQVGDPGLINLAAGLPSAQCVPKADLTKAFAATWKKMRMKPSVIMCRMATYGSANFWSTDFAGAESISTSIRSSSLPAVHKLSMG